MRLQFDRFRGFVEEFSANLSLGGMFIRTDEPREIGAEMPIEFRLGEDYELIKGKGRVVWVREEGLDEEHPAGMGIRFLELTPGSRELIFKLVERRVREGGEPFDLEAEAEILDDLPQRPPDPGPAPEKALQATEVGSEVEKALAEPAEEAADAPGRAAVEDEEFDPWEEAAPALAAPTAAASAAAAGPEDSAGQGERELFYLGDLPPGQSPEEPPPEEAPPEEPGFRDESFSAGMAGGTAAGASLGASRKVSPFGTPDVDAEAAGEGDPPAFPTAPAASPAFSYKPEGGGAAYDNEEERSFVRRRGLILGLILVLVFGGLAVGWWLLGQPPELESGSEPAAGGTAVAEERPHEDSPMPASPIDASDVEGGLGGVRATPPGQERETPPRGAGNADEGFPGAVAGDLAGRQPAPGPGTEGTSGDPPVAAEQAASGRGDGAPAGAAAEGPLRIESVSHQAAGSRTVVVIQASRRLRAGDFSDFRIGGLSPRHVVRLLGVDQPLPAGQVTVGTDQVARVRSGLHLDRDPSELHLVLDLNSDTARVTEITPAGDTLRVVVEEGAG